MRRAGNRQEFRQPLNQGQNNDVQRFHMQSLLINGQTGVFMLRRQQCTGIDENFARRFDAIWYADKDPVYLARFSPTGMLYLLLLTPSRFEARSSTLFMTYIWSCLLS